MTADGRESGVWRRAQAGRGIGAAEARQGWRAGGRRGKGAGKGAGRAET